MVEEQLRHQYLEALGVASFLPQSQLPAAAPSEEWVWDFRYPAPDIPFEDDVAAGAIPAEPKVSKADAASARASLTRSFASAPAPEIKQALWQESKPETKPEPTKPEPVSKTSVAEPVSEPGVESDESALEPTTSARSDRPQPRFKLALARFGRVLVVDSLPTQSQLGFSTQHQALASAIVRSVTGTLSPLTGKALLPWPAFASPTLPQGYDEALQTVQHKLDRALASGEADVLLVLGESAAQMVLEREESVSELAGILFTVRAGVKAVVTHSLSEAMQVPGIKPTMWQHLQPMLKHLNDASN